MNFARNKMCSLSTARKVHNDFATIKSEIRMFFKVPLKNRAITVPCKTGLEILIVCILLCVIVWLVLAVNTTDFQTNQFGITDKDHNIIDRTAWASNGSILYGYLLT
jgi:hypothetical protein